MGRNARQETILIIEDEAPIRAFVSRVLELEGYRVLQAAEGGEGLRLVKESKVSLVLLDLRLPDYDGWTILEKLKSDPELASIPVVMFTASAAESARNHALAAGVAVYLVKPLSAAGLRSTVNAILRGEGRHRNARE